MKEKDYTLTKLIPINIEIEETACFTTTYNQNDLIGGLYRGDSNLIWDLINQEDPFSRPSNRIYNFYNRKTNKKDTYYKSPLVLFTLNKLQQLDTVISIDTNASVKNNKYICRIEIKTKSIEEAVNIVNKVDEYNTEYCRKNNRNYKFI